MARFVCSPATENLYTMPAPPAVVDQDSLILVSNPHTDLSQDEDEWGDRHSEFVSPYNVHSMDLCWPVRKGTVWKYLEYHEQIRNNAGRDEEGNFCDRGWCIYIEKARLGVPRAACHAKERVVNGGDPVLWNGDHSSPIPAPKT